MRGAKTQRGWHAFPHGELRCVNAAPLAPAKLRRYSPDADEESGGHPAKQEDQVMAKTEVSTSNPKPAARPRDVFSAMRDEMERMFERVENGWPRWPTVFKRDSEVVVPELDVSENTNAITVEAELPGVEEKDVSVTLANGVLTIKGEKKSEKEEKGDNYYLAERSFGSFERSIRLPDTVDEAKVEAKFDKGVLKVTAAKKPEAVKAERKIEIKKS